MKLTIIGVVLVIAGLACMVLAAAQQRKGQTAGPDDRPGYYKQIGVSLWSHEMKNTTRHAQGRAWIDIIPNGSGRQGVVEQHLDVILWSSNPIDNLRIFNAHGPASNTALLLAKSGDEILTCGWEGSHTTVFPRRYVICGLAIPTDKEALIYVEVTDERVNTFTYSLPLSDLATEIQKGREWLENPK